MGRVDGREATNPVGYEMTISRHPLVGAQAPPVSGRAPLASLPIKGRDIFVAVAPAGALLATAALAAPADPPSPHRQLQPGVWLVEGSMREGRQPDGNSVILA